VVVDRPRSFALPRPSWPLSVNLGNAVTLLGFDVAPEESQSRIGPGQTVTLTLYFQSRATMDAPYSIFLHFVDNTERIWGQEDRPAGSSQYPTTLWWPGEVVSTTLTLTLSPDTPATRLTAYAGLYDPSTSVRLPVIGAPESANRFPLFTTNARR
jgi:hypothetical protein